MVKIHHLLVRDCSAVARKQIPFLVFVLFTFIKANQFGVGGTALPSMNLQIQD